MRRTYLNSQLLTKRDTRRHMMTQKRLRLFTLSAFLTLAATGAVRNDLRPAGVQGQQTEGVSGKNYEQHPSGKHIVSYKPIKFDTSSHVASGSSGSAVAHPYSFEESAPAETYHVASYAEEPNFGYPHHHKPAYFPVHKPTAGKFDLYKLLSGDPSYAMSPWRRMIKVLTAAIPIGLFIAALPPNVVNINATQNYKPLGTQQPKQRSGDTPDTVQTFPVLDMIEKRGGVRALQDADCEANLFCEIARLGKSENANSVQQGFWSVAHETPDSLAELLGAKELFKAIRTDACQIYKCPSKA